MSVAVPAGASTCRKLVYSSRIPPRPGKEHTMDPSFGQSLTMDHQRKVGRAEARERLSVVEQAAWGWLDDHAVPVHPGRPRRRIRLRKAWATVFAPVWGPA